MAETLDTGVVIPTPADVIDSSGVAAMRALGTSVDAALTDHSPFKGTLTGTMIAGGWDNVFTMPGGVVTIPNTTYAGQVANLPEVVPGVLTVGANEGSPVRSLTYAPHGREYVWQTQTLNVSGGFMPWRKVEGGGSGDATPGASTDLGQMHAARRDVFKRRRGGVIGTSGKPVVALRFDHGLVNFRDKVLPELRRLGLPGSMAMNSAQNRWDISESAGVTPANLDEWAVNDGIEVWNHSQTHGAAEDLAALTREIATGLADLQAKIPSVPIEGFVIPGVPSGNYNGFSAGETIDRWDTEAGRLIMGYHAVSSSHMPGTEQPLTGDYSILGRQVSIDSATAASVIAEVDSAVASGSGAILFLHPSQLDLAGKITTAGYTQILEHIAALRGAGELDVLTMGGLALADSARTARSNLAADSAFSQGTAAWGSPAGWTVATGGDLTTGSSADYLEQTVPLASRGWAAGSPRTLVARVKARGAGVLNVELTHGNTVRVFNIPAGVTDWTDVHLPGIVPLGATSVAIRVRRESGDYLHVQSIRLDAI